MGLPLGLKGEGEGGLKLGSGEIGGCPLGGL